MKFFLDSEFVEDGKTIDLISLGIVCEDGRTLYRQNKEAQFSEASDWVCRNVFPSLIHFDVSRGGQRSCKEPNRTSAGQVLTGRCAPECPWAYRWEIRDEVRQFCDPEKHGKPEFWGYYADYDWVAFCQLFGPMIELPKGYPMYCRDIKQWCDEMGNPHLPEQTGEHHALTDACWVRKAHAFLSDYASNRAHKA